MKSLVIYVTQLLFFAYNYFYINLLQGKGKAVLVL
jgi:hypothetical protein